MISIEKLLEKRQKITGMISTDKKYYEIGDVVKLMLTFKNGEDIYVDPDSIKVYYNNKMVDLENVGDGKYTFNVLLSGMQQDLLKVNVGRHGQSFSFDMKKVEKKSPYFRDFLNRTIDDTFENILGVHTAEVYSYMKYFGITCGRLAENPEALEKAMIVRFRAGWKVLRSAILRSLCQQLNVALDIFANHSFVQCMDIAEREFSKKMALQREETLQTKDNVFR